MVGGRQPMRIPLLTMIMSLALLGSASADGVRIGVNIGVPAPPPVIVAPPVPVVVGPPVVVAPPHLVVVPGSPVFYAPGVEMNFFAYGGRYYSFHQGSWFVAPRPGAPWVAVAPSRVPQPVLAVPVAYYKIPPGHAKKMDGRHGCPPGLAKHGRC